MYTTVTILCKDRTKRIIRCLGNLSYDAAFKLGKDIERENFLSVVIQK